MQSLYIVVHSTGASLRERNDNILQNELLGMVQDETCK